MIVFGCFFLATVAVHAIAADPPKIVEETMKRVLTKLLWPPWSVAPGYCWCRGFAFSEEQPHMQEALRHLQPPRRNCKLS